MKIIQLCGVANSGKTSAQKYMAKELKKKGYKVLKASYGDLLKFICKKYQKWDGEKDERGRSLLQYVGTDMIRSTRAYFFIDFLYNMFTLFEDDYDYVIIDDCRFRNELLFWQSTHWRVTNIYVDAGDRLRRMSENGVEMLTEEQKNHKSECTIRAIRQYCDITLDNNNSLCDLENDIGEHWVNYLTDIDNYN